MKTVYFFIFVILLGCEQKTSKKVESTNNLYDEKSNLIGNWISHDSGGFTFLEIKNNLTANYTLYIDKKSFGDKKKEKDFLYHSNAKIIISSDSIVSILIDHYRFDHKIKTDSLIEFDKMGIQKILLKQK